MKIRFQRPALWTIFLLSSLCLHFASTLSLWPRKLVRREPAIDVELVPKPFKGVAQPRRNSSRLRGKKIELVDLMPSLFSKRTQHFASDPAGARNNEIQAAQPSSGNDGIFSPSFSQVMTETTSLSRYVFSKIDDGLNYPFELKTRGIEGVVRARVSIDGEGNWLKSQTQVSSTNNYLRVLVWELLETYLDGPLPDKLLKKGTRCEFDLTFQFAITEHDDQALSSAQQKKIGSALSFYRHYQHSRLQFDLGPVHGLLPIPAVSLDILWIIKKTAGLLSEKKTDPLARYRASIHWNDKG